MAGQTGQWKWPVCLSRLVSDRRDTQTDADWTLKMARLPVPSAKKLGKSCWRGTNAAVASFRSCWRFCASSSLRFASLTQSPCVILYTKQQIKKLLNFISSVTFNALHYVVYGICPTYYFHCLSACPVCWTLVGQANGPFSLCSIFLWPICHVQDKNGPFPLSRHFQGPVCMSHLPVPSVRHRWPRWDSQIGHFHCPVFPIMF